MIEARCLANSTPYLTLNTYGFFGIAHLWTQELAIIESKPADVEIHDLRLTEQNFPALKDYVEKYRPHAEMTDAEHKHLPFPVLLAHFQQ